MFKALFKKQLMEINSWIFQDKKSGKARTSGGIAALIILYVLLFGMVAFMFFGLSASMFVQLSAVGLKWLYFAMMGLISILLGVFGSVFSTYSSLYKAKDNDLLLAMPIPIKHIIFVRLFGVWLWSTIYSALVFIPAIAVYQIFGGFDPLGLFCEIILFIAISFFVLTLSCLLGWVVAKISLKIKNRSFVTVIISLAFMVIYYVVYFRANEILQNIVANAEDLSQDIKGFAYPLYAFGSGCTGNLLSTILITLGSALLFLAVFMLLKKSFIRIATVKDKVSSAKFKNNTAKKQNILGALLKKELKHFTSSSSYMLNCALGTVLLPTIGILALIKGNEFVSALLDQSMEIKPFLLIIVTIATCAVSSMNDITAPSISLEGRSIWLAHSLPISPWICLKAKLALHLLITLIPTVFCSICLGIVIRPGIFGWTMLILLPILFVLFNASIGLAANLLFPNLNWTQEVVAVKQSFVVIIPMLGVWLISGIFIALYFIANLFMASEIYLLLCSLIMAVVDFLILLWIYKKGTKIFAKL